MRGAVARPVALAALALLPALASCFSRPLEPSDPAPPRRPDPGAIPAPTPGAEPRREAPVPERPAIGIGPLVRIAVLSATGEVSVGAADAWRLVDATGNVVARGAAEGGAAGAEGSRPAGPASGRATWRVQRDGRRLRAVRDGAATPWHAGALSLIVDAPPERAVLHLGGKAYRGALDLIPTDTGLLAINVLGLEDYLRGVVPLEIGERPAAERAAVEAQAIAARSFAVTRIRAARAGSGRSLDFDLIASTGDQVYGGRDAERPVADAAVRATAGLVLLLDGRVVTAPFSSTCGGETAAAEEVWRSDGEPHLKRVSDRIPGSDRYYCDIAPRFAWTRVLSGDELDDAVRRYLGAYHALPAGGPGRVRGLAIEGRTPSGRVASLAVETERGTFRLRGNDARSVLRSGGGETLNSAYFSVSVESSAGRLVRAVLRGNGYGHGVGMCQWGAIGRARAGQDARTILRTYYTGTTLGTIPPGLLDP